MNERSPQAEFVRDMINFHAQNVKEYFCFWRHIEDRESVEMSVEEAAYHFLKHVGLLCKFTGDLEAFNMICEQSADDRKKLTIDACNYAKGFSLAESARSILKDFGSLGEFEFDRDRLADVIMSLKDLSMVMRMIEVIYHDGFEYDDEIQDPYNEVEEVVSDLQSLLEEEKFLEPVTSACLSVFQSLSFMKAEKELPSWFFADDLDGVEPEFDNPIESLLSSIKCHA